MHSLQIDITNKKEYQNFLILNVNLTFSNIDICPEAIYTFQYLQIRVEAYDQGVPAPLSSDLDLTIYIRNINDFEPQFLKDQMIVNFTGKRFIQLIMKGVISLCLTST